MRTTMAQQNAAKIRELMINGGHADLYRTAVAGPRGQRADLLVGRVRWLDWGPYDFSVIDMGEARRVGFATRSADRPGMWTLIESLDLDTGDTHRLIGWATSLSIGVDVLVNGAFAVAYGNADSRRISGGGFEPYISSGQ